MTTDTTPITHSVLQMVQKPDPNAAHRLVCIPAKNKHDWLPESLMAFNVAGLSPQQQLHMTRALFNAIHGRTESTILAECNARLGQYGFSFPIWRFLAQGSLSLLEQFGMARLKRPTDIRDPRLPNPARDLFGTGFVTTHAHTYIEYRRAYIICADRDATLIIRNNSYFYGRDRLPDPVYVAFRKIPHYKLEKLVPQDFTNLTRWQDIAYTDPHITLIDKARHVERLINTLDSFDMQLSLWLKGDGLTPMVSFLKNLEGPTPYISTIDARMPPWFPKSSTPVTSQVISELEAYRNGQPLLTPNLKAAFNAFAANKMVLLSGPAGDYPVRATTPKP